MTEVIPAGDYNVVRRVGDFIFTAGMTPRRDGALLAMGVLGGGSGGAGGITLEEGRDLASYAAGRALDAMTGNLEGNDRLASIVSMTVFIASDPLFTELGAVADGASERIRQALPESPMPVRAAIGVASLPGGAPVEVQMIGSISRG